MTAVLAFGRDKRSRLSEEGLSPLLSQVKRDASESISTASEHKLQRRKDWIKMTDEFVWVDSLVRDLAFPPKLLRIDYRRYQREENKSSICCGLNLKPLPQTPVLYTQLLVFSWEAVAMSTSGGSRSLGVTSFSASWFTMKKTTSAMFAHYCDLSRSTMLPLRGRLSLVKLWAQTNLSALKLPLSGIVSQGHKSNKHGVCWYLPGVSYQIQCTVTPLNNCSMFLRFQISHQSEAWVCNTDLWVRWRGRWQHASGQRVSSLKSCEQLGTDILDQMQSCGCSLKSYRMPKSFAMKIKATIFLFVVTLNERICVTLFLICKMGQALTSWTQDDEESTDKMFLRQYLAYCDIQNH